MCPNVCASAGEEHRRVVEAERKMRKTGSKIRSSYIAHAQKEKARLEVSIQSLKSELALKEIEETRARGTFKLGQPDINHDIDIAACSLKRYGNIRPLWMQKC